MFNFFYEYVLWKYEYSSKVKCSYKLQSKEIGLKLPGTCLEDTWPYFRCYLFRVYDAGLDWNLIILLTRWCVS